MSQTPKHRERVLKEIVAAAFILSISAYILLPSGWEPGGEDWKKWLAARMLLDGQWPSTQMSVLYWAYAAGLMQLFDYPVFVKIEYFLTHTFFMLAMFSCLRHWLTYFAAIFVAIAYIPATHMIEGASVLFASGFVFLYIGRALALPKQPLVPLTLVAAACAHAAFAPMLAGHVLGSFLERTYALGGFKKATVSKGEIARLGGAIIMAAILAMAWLNPSQQPFNNHYMNEMPWAPIPVNPRSSGLELATFQIAPHYYLSRRMHADQLIDQDWYYTADTVLGGAKSLREAISKSPHVFLENAYHNLRNVPYAINKFLFHWNVPIVGLIAAIISAIAFWVTTYSLIKTGQYAVVGAVWACITSVGGALFLTWIGNSRYDVVLFPLLLAIVFFTLHRLEKKHPRQPLKIIMAVSIIFGAIIASLMAQKQNSSQGDSFLERDGGYTQSYKQIGSLIRENEVILANESVWLRAFFRLRPEQIISAQVLPPFSDPDNIALLLSGVTEIWVTPSMSTKEPSVSTQSYLRYMLHIEPFLKTANWEVFEIRGFGKIYRRPLLESYSAKGRATQN